MQKLCDGTSRDHFDNLGGFGTERCKPCPLAVYLGLTNGFGSSLQGLHDRCNGCGWRRPPIALEILCKDRLDLVDLHLTRPVICAFA